MNVYKLNANLNFGDFFRFKGIFYIKTIPKVRKNSDTFGIALKNNPMVYFLFFLVYSFRKLSRAIVIDVTPGTGASRSKRRFASRTACAVVDP